MEYYFILFGSRSQTHEFGLLMNSYGARARLANTPRQIVSSCSVCIQTDINGVSIAQSILSRRKFESYNGIYKAVQNGLNINIQPFVGVARKT